MTLLAPDRPKDILHFGQINIHLLVVSNAIGQRMTIATEGNHVQELPVLVSGKMMVLLGRSATASRAHLRFHWWQILVDNPQSNRL
jgi:hypothetical protein